MSSRLSAAIKVGPANESQGSKPSRASSRIETACAQPVQLREPCYFSISGMCPRGQPSTAANALARFEEITLVSPCGSEDRTSRQTCEPVDAGRSSGLRLVRIQTNALPSMESVPARVY
jgi:hypothetical protein